MRLIDADRLLSERMKSMYYHLPNGDIAIPIIDIERAPTIESEIIHCQGCKYAKKNQGELWICAHPDNNAWRITKEFYCGRVERREEP